jgi:predicted anti-sigma-YlaC factor YlaD
MTTPIQLPFDCAAVDARLADYLDDEAPDALPAAERAALERHVATCARCRALVRDLDGIGEAAAALPAFAPPRDLWPDIAARLVPRAPGVTPADDDAPVRVLPFAVHRVRHTPPALTPRVWRTSGGPVGGSPPRPSRSSPSRRAPPT